MGKLNARKVAALAKGEPRKTADGNGIYFVVPSSEEPFGSCDFQSTVAVQK
ncbi:MAG: hypothetical protein CENE_01668 [Candidatus Celerinatantimonas neptuna]|nr:MAG: hypothetical protein CENE_01668 [Candidatus Celerinatantimonas neptuna]